MRGPDAFRHFPPSMSTDFPPYRAIVQYIVDGDTIDCLIDFGFNEYRYSRIRFAGINAPEKSFQSGIDAKEHLASILPEETPVMLKTEKDPDSFGRYIAWVIVEDGTVINHQMVSDGHAAYKKY